MAASLTGASADTSKRAASGSAHRTWPTSAALAGSGAPRGDLGPGEWPRFPGEARLGVSFSGELRPARSGEARPGLRGGDALFFPGGLRGDDGVASSPGPPFQDLRPSAVALM